MKSRLGPRPEMPAREESQPQFLNVLVQYPNELAAEICSRLIEELSRKKDPFEEKPVEIFTINDLRFLDIRNPFKAQCLQINSHRDLILQVTKFVDGDFTYGEEYAQQMKQFFTGVANSLKK